MFEYGDLTADDMCEFATEYYGWSDEAIRVAVGFGGDNVETMETMLFILEWLNSFDQEEGFEEWVRANIDESYNRDDEEDEDDEGDEGDEGDEE